MVLELGIGSQNRIIKPVLYQVTHREPMATFITINLPHEIVVPQEIGPKAIALPCNAATYDAFEDVGVVAVRGIIGELHVALHFKGYTLISFQTSSLCPRLAQ